VTVDQAEGDFGAENRVLPACHPRVGLENRLSRLLDGNRNDLAGTGKVLGVGGLVADHRQSAKTDVLQLAGRRADANPRRAMWKQFTRFVTGRPKPDFPALGALKLLIREHFCPLHRLRRCPWSPLWATRLTTHCATPRRNAVSLTNC